MAGALSIETPAVAKDLPLTSSFASKALLTPSIAIDLASPARTESAASAASTAAPTSATATAASEDNRRPRVAWGQGTIY
jgi:hypothetical protein